jgi:hypothetical protein
VQQLVRHDCGLAQLPGAADRKLLDAGNLFHRDLHTAEGSEPEYYVNSMLGGVKVHEVFLIVTHAPSINLRGGQV